MVAREDIEVARALRLGLGVEELPGLLERERARDAIVLVAQVEVLEPDEHDATVDEGEADVALQAPIMALRRRGWRHRNVACAHWAARRAPFRTLPRPRRL